MGKHILNGVDGFDKRGGEFFLVDPRVINVVGGWNHRTDFAGEDELMLSIIENGVKVPLLVKKTENGTLDLADGERRLRAVLKAIGQGHDIKSIPVQVAKRGTNDIDLYIESLVRNTGKPPTPTEEAEAYTRLINWGLSVKEISKKVGRSETLIRNRLELNNAAPTVKDALNKGEISTVTAQKIAKDSCIEKQNTALKNSVNKKKRPKPFTLFFDGGEVKHKGGRKGVNLEFLYQQMMSNDLKTALLENGFDPATFKISIEPIDNIN